MNESTAQGNFSQGASVTNSTRNCNRWSISEDRALINAMNDLLDLGGWKTNYGQFKNGAYAKLEALMQQKMPSCDKKAKPHIKSRVKLLRKQYDAIAEMLSPSASGFGWNDDGKFVTCPQSVWNEWIKSHKNATVLRNKPFPFFDDLAKIFGKDRAAGNEATNVHDVLEEVDEEERGEEHEVPQYTGEDISEHEVPQYTGEDISSTPLSNSVGPTPSTTPTTSKTKRARTETIEVLKEFSTKVGKISEVMEVASEHIGRFANCFQHESDSAERRMKVTAEVMKIEGLSPTEVILVSKQIALNPLEVDFFFSLPDDYKYPYVQGLLLPYH